MAAAWPWRAWLPLAFAITLPGCLVTLESGVACGDGFVDRRAGEECDPAAEREAFACGNAAFISGCDPESCRCTLCGDGIIDEGEECDGTDVGEATCLDGTDAVGCQGCILDYSDCPLCGNGVRDAPMEECDYLVMGDIIQPTDCSELPSPFGDMRPYASGEITTCGTDCRFDRSGCGFCGNNEVDPSYNLMGMITFPEACDGDQADSEELAEFCRIVCAGTPLTTVTYDCDFTCSSDCRRLEEVAEPECCLVKDERCPGAGSDDKCCWELDPANQDSPLEPCEEVLVGMLLSSVCR